MMNNNNFYTPEEIRPLYGEIIPAYQTAFADEPWNEVSKCPDKLRRCESGMSKLAIGSFCDTCGLSPSRPAYEAEELTARFDGIGLSRPTAWYAEQNDKGLTMAAMAWEATPSAIATEKYAEVPAMREWMVDKLGNKPIMWLDEVFANRNIKSRGNLQNFGKFVTGLAQRLNCDSVAYRTVQPRMTAAPVRDFGEKAEIFRRGEKAPDKRDFIIINNVEEAI